MAMFKEIVAPDKDGKPLVTRVELTPQEIADHQSERGPVMKKTAEERIEELTARLEALEKGNKPI